MRGQSRFVRIVPTTLYCSRGDHTLSSDQFEVKANGCYHSWCIPCKRWYQRVYARRKGIKAGKVVRPQMWKGPPR